MGPAQQWAAPGARALPPVAGLRPAHHQHSSSVDPVHFHAFMPPCLLLLRCLSLYSPNQTVHVGYVMAYIAAEVSCPSQACLHAMCTT